MKWLSDSVQKEVIIQLAERQKCIEDLGDAMLRIDNKDAQIRRQGEKITTLDYKFSTCAEQKSLLQREIEEKDIMIERRDKQIKKHKMKQILTIGGFSVAIVGVSVGLIYLAVQ
jgi:hypothetical protein